MAPHLNPAHSDMFTDSVIQEFINWVEEHKCAGATFKPDFVERPDFIPDSAIKEYFSCYQDSDHERVKKLVAAATKHSSTPANAKAIAQKCSKVFTILVVIGYPHFISNFVQNARLHDRRLPFRADEARLFPKLEGGTTFFDAFNAQQWHFCVEPMTNIPVPVQFDDPIVLPIIRIEELDKGAGASAVVRKIVVHEDYDDIEGLSGDGGREQQRTSEPHVYVVKSYHRLDAERYFRAEADAFQKLNEIGRPIPNFIGFHGAFIQNKSFNILLQYANIGTLEDYFLKATPPKHQNDILTLWRNLFRLADAVVDIHGLPQSSAPEQLRIFQGWHQDIKPENIFVAGDLHEAPYDVLFMLGDLGLSHFTAVLEDQAGLTGEDKSGTPAYNSPEINLARSSISNFEKQVKQKNDTWALACVLSEVNTWIVEGMDGKYGLRNYRTQRQNEVDAQGPSMGSCFHNHKRAVLKTVEEWHDYLPTVCVNQDYVTSIIWDELLKYMFKPYDRRLDASQVQDCSETVIKKARSSSTRREPTYLSFRPDDRTSDSPPHTPPELPPEFQDQTHQFLSANPANVPITPPPSDQPKRSQSLSPHHLGRITQSPESFKLNGSPTSPIEGRDLSLPIDSGRNSLLKKVPGVEDTQRPFSADSEPPTVENSQGPTSGFFGPPSRHSTYEPMYTQSNITIPRQELPGEWQAKISKRPTTHEEPGEYSRQTIPVSNSGLTGFASAMPELSGEARSKGKERSIKGLPMHNKAPAKPSKDLPVQELHSWAEKTRAAPFTKYLGQREFPLPFEDELLGQLKKRDHIFVIDDAESMKPHWSNMQSLFADLIYLVKKKGLDPNGSELQFIMSDQRKEAKDTTDLVRMVERMGTQLKGQTNFAARLDDIWEGYKKKLEGKRKLARPISLYVLTNGIWQLGSGEKERVARVIKRIVEHLEKMGAIDKMVGIQFIRFGDDAVGKKRLKWLDASLQMEWSLARDICDTTSAKGNVWKMMLGSINPYWDDDDGNDDNEDD